MSSKDLPFTSPTNTSYLSGLFSIHDFVSCLKPNPTVLKLYEQVLQGINQEVCKDIHSEIENIKAQLSQKRKQIEEVEDLLIEDRTNSERYSKIIARYEKEAQELEYRIEMMRNGDWKETKPKLHYAISLINNIVMYVQDAPLEVKIKLIGSIFPEKVQFDGKNYRTKKMNRVLDLIYQQTNELRGRGKQKKDRCFTISPFQ